MNSDVATTASNRSEPLASGATKQARPFLKWAGGKRQLLPQIRQFYPRQFGRYVEPFFGSGAVFFDLYSQGLLSRRQSTLIDNNADLVGCHLAVRDSATQVIRHLERLASALQGGSPRALLHRAGQAVQSGSAADLQWRWPG